MSAINSILLVKSTIPGLFLVLYFGQISKILSPPPFVSSSNLLGFGADLRTSPSFRIAFDRFKQPLVRYEPTTADATSSYVQFRSNCGYIRPAFGKLVPL